MTFPNRDPKAFLSNGDNERIFQMLRDAKEKALGGCSMNAKMLMNLLKVEGGRDVLLSIATPPQLREIKNLADRYQAPT